MDLGLERAGMDVAWHCELDEYRRAVLHERFEGTIYDDVRTLCLGEPESGSASDASDETTDDGGRGTWAGLPVRVDLLCGGFPCQDLSVAGQRKGLKGDRSGLFHEFARITGTLRPEWLLLENVPGLFSSNSGRDFGELLGTLADLGYGVAWRILDSQHFGVPQRRRRVFILGCIGGRAGAERARQVLAVGEGCDRHHEKGGEKRENAAAPSLSGLGSGGPDDNDGQAGRLVVGKCLTTRQGRLDADTQDFVACVSGGSSVRRLTPRECERLQGLPDDWTLIDWRRKPAPDSRRYAAVGDAVTVDVAEWIGRRLMAAPIRRDSL